MPINTALIPRTQKIRAQALIQRRALKMAASPNAYVRGNTTQFYAWLEEHDDLRIPHGPDVWICGDCHFGNLGPVSDTEGDVEVQIRDLDQTVIGNPTHDIIRLGLSLAMSARGSELPGVTTVKMLEAVMRGYQRALVRSIKSEDPPSALAQTFRYALSRRWRHLARERIEDTTPTVPIGKSFWPLMKEERIAIEKLFEQEPVRALLTTIDGRDADTQVRLLDSAYWVKGCSSLGVLRFVALAGVGKSKRHILKNNDLCLVDIKQAGPAAAPRSPTAEMPRDNGTRVVTGAQQLSPHLGERMFATHMLERSVVVRELLPQDIKFNISRLGENDAIEVAQYLGHVVGRAHWRQMESPTRRTWTNELKRARSKTIDAPSWLWSSVVELIARHEAAYLDHCRKYALSPSRRAA